MVAAEMSAAEFRDALARLEMTQVRFAEVVRVTGRTARKWALEESEVPEGVAVLARLLVAGKITESDIEAAWGKDETSLLFVIVRLIEQGRVTARDVLRARRR
jgi:transcriptional regulator with XRE-family HTH domain